MSLSLWEQIIQNLRWEFLMILKADQTLFIFSVLEDIMNFVLGAIQSDLLNWEYEPWRIHRKWEICQMLFWASFWGFAEYWVLFPLITKIEYWHIGIWNSNGKERKLRQKRFLSRGKELWWIISLRNPNLATNYWSMEDLFALAAQGKLKNLSLVDWLLSWFEIELLLWFMNVWTLYISTCIREQLDVRSSLKLRLSCFYDRCNLKFSLKLANIIQGGDGFRIVDVACSLEIPISAMEWGSIQFGILNPRLKYVIIFLLIEEK